MGNQNSGLTWSEINRFTTYVCTFFSGVALASTLHSFSTGHFGLSVFFFAMTLAMVSVAIGAGRVAAR